MLHNAILIISFRYLKSKKHRYLPSLIASLSFFGITIGVATLIVVMSVMNGFREELMAKIVGINAHISLYATSKQAIEDMQLTKNNIVKEPNVVNASLVLQSQGMLINSANNSSTGTIIRGMFPEDFQAKSQYFNSYAGKEAIKNQNSIALGSELAAKIGLRVNDSVLLVSGNSKQTIFGTVLRNKTYKISNIINFGMQQYDSIMSFMNIHEAKIFFGDSAIGAIEINVDKPEMATQIAYLLQKKQLTKGYEMVDWQQENSHLVHALKVESNVMFFILSLFVIVATFSIFANLSMMVNEKYKNIAILRSMGFSSMNIGQVFLLTGLIIAIFGCIFGVLLGYIFANNIQAIKLFLENTFHTELFNSAVYFLSNLPSKVEISNIITIAVMTVTFAVIASILPAIKASKCKPAEALKYY
jgi:lipoprotein-releasing system permease protein